MPVDYKSTQATDILNDKSAKPEDLHSMANQFVAEGRNHDNVTSLVQHPNLSNESIGTLNNSFEATKAIYPQGGPDMNHVALMGHPKVETHQARQFVNENFQHIKDSPHWSGVFRQAKYSPEERRSLADKHVREKMMQGKSPEHGFDNDPEYFLNMVPNLEDDPSLVMPEGYSKEHLYPFIEKQLLTNQNHTSETLNQTIDVYNGNDKRLRQLMRSQQEKLTPAHVDQMIANGGDQQKVLQIALMNTHSGLKMSQDTLISAINNSDEVNQSFAATSPQLSSENVVKMLTTNPNHKIWGKLLSNDNLPKDKQLEYATKFAEKIDLGAAGILDNQNLDEEAVNIILSNDVSKSLAMKTWSQSGNIPVKAVPHLLDDPKYLGMQSDIITRLVSRDDQKYNEAISENFHVLSPMSKIKAIKGSAEIAKKHLPDFIEDNPSTAAHTDKNIISSSLDPEQKTKLIPYMAKWSMEKKNHEAVVEIGKNFLDTHYLTTIEKQEIINHVVDHRFDSETVIKGINQDIFPDRLDGEERDLFASLGKERTGVKNKDFLLKVINASHEKTITNGILAQAYSNEMFSSDEVVDLLEKNPKNLDILKNADVAFKVYGGNKGSLDKVLDFTDRLLNGEIKHYDSSLIDSNLRTGESAGLSMIGSAILNSPTVPMEYKQSFFDKSFGDEKLKFLIPAADRWPKSIQTDYLEGKYPTASNFTKNLFDNATVDEAPHLAQFINRTGDISGFALMHNELQAIPEIYEAVAKHDVVLATRGLTAHLIQDASDYHNTNWQKHLDFITQNSSNPTQSRADWINNMGAGLRKWQQSLDKIDYNPLVDEFLAHANSGEDFHQSASYALRNLIDFDLIDSDQTTELVNTNQDFAKFAAFTFSNSSNPLSKQGQTKVVDSVIDGSMPVESFVTGYGQGQKEAAENFNLFIAGHAQRKDFLKKVLSEGYESVASGMSDHLDSIELADIFFTPEVGDMMSDNLIVSELTALRNRKVAANPAYKAYVNNRISKMSEATQLKAIQVLAVTDPVAMGHILDHQVAGEINNIEKVLETHGHLITQYLDSDLEDIDRQNLQKASAVVSRYLAAQTSPEQIKAIKTEVMNEVSDRLFNSDVVIDDDTKLEKIFDVFDAYKEALNEDYLKSKMFKICTRMTQDHLGKTKYSEKFLSMGLAKTSSGLPYAIDLSGNHPQYAHEIFESARIFSVKEEMELKEWMQGKDGKCPDSLWQVAYNDAQYADIQDALTGYNGKLPKDDELKEKVLGVTFQRPINEVPVEYFPHRPELSVQKALQENNIQKLFSAHYASSSKELNEAIFKKLPEVLDSYKDALMDESNSGAVNHVHELLKFQPQRWREVASALAPYIDYPSDTFYIQDLVKNIGKEYSLTEKDCEDLTNVSSNALLFTQKTPINAFRKHFPFKSFEDGTLKSNPESLATEFNQVEGWHQHEDLREKYLEIVDRNDSLQDDENVEDFLKVAMNFPEKNKEEILGWMENKGYKADLPEYIQKGLGGSIAVDRFFKNYTPEWICDQLIYNAAYRQNKHIEFRHLKEIMDNKITGIGTHRFPDLLKFAPEIFDKEATSYLMSKIDLDDKEDFSLIKGVSLLKNIGKEDFDKCFDILKNNYTPFFLPNTPFNPCYVNEAHGHQKLLESPSQLPDELHSTVNASNLAKTFVDKKGVKQLEALMPHIGEAIDYKTLKQIDPKFDKMPEVKAMFQKNHKITPEMVAKRMEELNGDGYHLTYSIWDGAQRYMDDGKPNMVVQLNASKKMRDELASNPKRLEFYNMINRIATRIHPANPEAGGHPNTPHIVSWVRVNTNNPKHWIVEEFQSDFTSTLASELGDLKRRGHSTFTDDETGMTFDTNEAIQFAKEIEKIMGDWGNTSISGMEEFAKSQGVENLYIHGVGLRAALSGLGKESEGSSKLEELYYKNPEKHGYEAIQYREYPQVNKRYDSDTLSYKDKQIPNKCWRKKLT